MHECVERDHNLVIAEDCSTSWSSDGDDDSTSSSLNKTDDDATSVAHEDSTSRTLGGDLDDDGSCSGHDCDATTSSPTLPHCFMSQGDTRYLMLMWLIMSIHMMSLLVDLLA